MGWFGGWAQLFTHGFESFVKFLVVEKGIHGEEIFDSFLFCKHFLLIAEVEYLHVSTYDLLIKFLKFTLQFFSCSSFLSQLFFKAFLILLKLKFFFDQEPIKILLLLKIFFNLLVHLCISICLVLG